MNSWGSNTCCTEIFTPGQSNARGRVNQPRIVSGASTAVAIPVPSTRHASPKWSYCRVTSGIKNPSDPIDAGDGAPRGVDGPSDSPSAGEARFGPVRDCRAGVIPGPGLGPGPLMKYSTNDPPGRPSPRAVPPNAEAGGAVPGAAGFDDESDVASAAILAVLGGAVPPNAEAGGPVPPAGVFGAVAEVQVQRRAV